jgi:hypothetical protein
MHMAARWSAGVQVWVSLGAARAEQDDVSGRRILCRLRLAQEWGTAELERSAWWHARLGRSRERRSACFGYRWTWRGMAWAARREDWRGTGRRHEVWRWHCTSSGLLHMAVRWPTGVQVWVWRGAARAEQDGVSGQRILCRL